MRRLSVALMVLALSADTVGPLATAAEPPAAGTFDPAGSLAEARTSHSATLLPDGRVLVVGGRDADHTLATAEVWEPDTPSTTE